MTKNRNTFEKTRREAEKKRNAQEKRLRRQRKLTDSASANRATASEPVDDAPNSPRQ